MSNCAARAFWGGLILLAITLVRHDHQSSAVTAPAGGYTTQRPSPQEILVERLGRGEIDTDDYRQRLDALREPPTCDRWNRDLVA